MDCACTPDSHIQPSRSANISAVPLTRAHTVYQRRLTDDHTLALNLLGDQRVTVLNQPALTLLSQFRQPCTIADCQPYFPDQPTRAISDAVTQLHALALIEPSNPIRLVDQVQTYNPSSRAGETLTAWLHVTNQCNLRCPYCYVHKTPDKMALQTGQQSIDAVIRSAVGQGFQQVKLKYAGGEATLNFGLIAELQRYAEQKAQQHQLELQTVILSNGVVISERMIDLLHHHNIKLMVSLDGVGEVHDQHRPFISGRGSFAQVEKSLNRLIKRGITPDISITLSNQNAAHLAETVEYVLHRDLPFSLNFYRENECSAGHGDLQYANQQIIEAMQAAFAVIERNLPKHSLLNALVDRANLSQAHTRTCGVGENYLVINQDGGVAKCHMEIEKPITSIHAADPLAVLQQDKLGIQNLPVDEKEGCRECDWRYWCAGGCPLLTYRATGRYDIKSPNCSIYKAIFPEVLRLEGLRILKYHANAEVA